MLDSFKAFLEIVIFLLKNNNTCISSPICVSLLPTASQHFQLYEPPSHQKLQPKQMMETAQLIAFMAFTSGLFHLRRAVFHKTQIAHCFPDTHNMFICVFCFWECYLPIGRKASAGERPAQSLHVRVLARTRHKAAALSHRRLRTVPSSCAGTLAARTPGKLAAPTGQGGNTGVWTAHTSRFLSLFYLLHYCCLGAGTSSEARRCCCTPAAARDRLLPGACLGSRQSAICPGRQSALNYPGSKTSESSL